MVKTPRTRHSNAEREPMTIELGPDEVSRVSTEAEASPTDMEPGAETVKEDIAASETGTEPGDHAAQPAAETPTDEAAREASMPLDEEPRPAAGRADTSETAERPSAWADAPAAPPPARSRSGAALAAGLAGGLIVLVGGGLLQFAGVLGTPAAPDSPAGIPASVETDIATLKSDVEGLKAAPGDTGDVSGRVDALSQALDQVKADVASLRQAVESGSSGETAGSEAINAKIAEIETRINAIGPSPDGATREDIAALNDKIAGVEALARAAGEADSSINNRLGALEQSIAALTGKVDSQAQQPKVALAIVASALKAAVERGSPFEPELETLAAVAPQAPGLAELRPYAEKGIATRAEIVAETDAAAAAIIAAARPPSEDAGYFERLLSSAESLVTVRPIGAVEGPGVPETVARMEVALKAGDLAKAIAEFDTLPEPAKTAGAAFADKIRARLAVEQLADQAIASAMQAP